MIRIHEMWQTTKRELAEAQAELVRRNACGDKAMQQLQALTIELRDKCRFTELQLAGAREESANISVNCDDLRQQLGNAHSQLAGLQATTQHQAPMINELQAMVERIKHEKQSLAEHMHAEQKRLEQTISNKDRAMQLQEQKLVCVSDELRCSMDAHTSTSAAVENANTRISELERTNGELGKQLMNAKEQLRYLHLSRRSEVQVQALLHQLQLDNARLVKLLSSTEEYKDFVAYSEDSGGITYIPPPSYVSPPKVHGSPLKRDVGLLEPQRERIVRGAVAEMEHWVPSDAYALANDFRRQHLSQLPMDLFAELLLRLNRVWRAREAKRMERHRVRGARKIGELRRRVAQQVPYEEVLQSSEVERLRRELREMRTAFNTGRRKLNETEERLLESSIESACAIDTQLLQQMQQNEQLLAELADVELRAHSAFGEGVLAASSSASELCDRFAERITELMREFQRKTLHINRTDADLYMRMLHLQSWFLESLDRRVVQCREKVGGVYEATLASRGHQWHAMVIGNAAAAQSAAPAFRSCSGVQSKPDAHAHAHAHAPPLHVQPSTDGMYATSATVTPREPLPPYLGPVDGGDSDDFDD